MCRPDPIKVNVLHCDVKYRGNWNPDIDMSIRDDKKANINVSSEQITSRCGMKICPAWSAVRKTSNINIDG